MIGRPLRIDWPENDTPDDLKEASVPERRDSRPMHLLWLVRSWPIKAAAEAVGVHYRSAQRWVEWYTVASSIAQDGLSRGF